MAQTLTYLMTVTNTDGSVSDGAATDADVMRSLAIASRRGCKVEVTPRGEAFIAREVPGKGSHRVAYRPFRTVGHLTATARNDLRLIAVRPVAGFNPETGCIKAGYVNQIPPAASALLISRGLVTVDGTTARLSASARLAMLCLAHAPAPWGHVLTPAELAEFVAQSRTAFRTAA